jgi:hypothetical protein
MLAPLTQEQASALKRTEARAAVIAAGEKGKAYARGLIEAADGLRKASDSLGGTDRGGRPARQLRLAALAFNMAAEAVLSAVEEEVREAVEAARAAK